MTITVLYAYINWKGPNFFFSKNPSLYRFCLYYSLQNISVTNMEEMNQAS